MSKWNVVFNLHIERTYEVEAPDEATAIKNAGRDGRVVNETEEDRSLEHVEQKDRD